MARKRLHKLVSYTDFAASKEDRTFQRVSFLDRASQVPGLIRNTRADRFGLEKGFEFPLGAYGRWRHSAEPIREFLLNWSKEWHLDADWVRQTAFRALCFWAIDTNLPRSLGIFVMDSAGAGITSPGPGGIQCYWPSEIPTYYPARMDREHYLRSIRALVIRSIEKTPLLNLGDTISFVESIIESLKPYCDAREHELPKAGSYSEFDRDIDWAVKVQVEDWGFEDISKDLKPQGRDAYARVRMAVNRILDDVQISRRVQRGRRKGSKVTTGRTHLGLNKNVRDFT